MIYLETKRNLSRNYPLLLCRHPMRRLWAVAPFQQLRLSHPMFQISAPALISVFHQIRNGSVDVDHPCVRASVSCPVVLGQPEFNSAVAHCLSMIALAQRLHRVSHDICIQDQVINVMNISSQTYGIFSFRMFAGKSILVSAWAPSKSSSCLYGLCFACFLNCGDCRAAAGSGAGAAQQQAGGRGRGLPAVPGRPVPPRVRLLQGCLPLRRLSGAPPRRPGSGIKSCLGFSVKYGIQYRTGYQARRPGAQDLASNFV